MEELEKLSSPAEMSSLLRQYIDKGSENPEQFQPMDCAPLFKAVEDRANGLIKAIAGDILPKTVAKGNEQAVDVLISKLIEAYALKKQCKAAQKAIELVEILFQ